VIDELGVRPSAPVTGLETDSLPAYGTMNAARQAEFWRAEQIARLFGAKLDVAELDNGADGRHGGG